MLTVINLSFVDDLAEIDLVGKQVISGQCLPEISCLDWWRRLSQKCNFGFKD